VEYGANYVIIEFFSHEDILISIMFFKSMQVKLTSEELSVFINC